MIQRFVLAVLLSILATACAPSVSGGLVDSGDRYALQAADEGEYRLGVGDQVKLTVFNEPTLSGEFSVAANGSMSIPLVGDIPAMNMTTDEIGKAVQTKLADGYLREPRVSVEVVKFRPFFILGEVKAPGQYPYANGLTVLNAVATAEGFTPRAQRKVAYIRRAGSSVEEAYSLTPDLRVYPGDTVRVGERYF
ncbi:polysaccharide biosynthesis/export family protein [Novosphingobium sp. RD2P27]|uniref:Polysaccharide biosynthesis/export family protein n=1 Tax=Novosphingobium kalidii TaxID=3230299 RepID=A0ABV2CZZ1_9SPHN